MSDSAYFTSFVLILRQSPFGGEMFVITKDAVNAPRAWYFLNATRVRYEQNAANVRIRLLRGI